MEWKPLGGAFPTLYTEMASVVLDDGKELTLNYLINGAGLYVRLGTDFYLVSAQEVVADFFRNAMADEETASRFQALEVHDA